MSHTSKRFFWAFTRNRPVDSNRDSAPQVPHGRKATGAEVASTHHTIVFMMIVAFLRIPNTSEKEGERRRHHAVVQLFHKGSLFRCSIVQPDEPITKQPRASVATDGAG